MAGRKDQVARPGNGKGCSCTTLRKATRRISQLYDTALAPSGLKTTQHAILAQIGRSEPTTVGELAGALVMDSGALAHTLRWIPGLPGQAFSCVRFEVAGPRPLVAATQPRSFRSSKMR